ncbi:tetratricopeptide repeat protein [Candidatus Cardinium hertigii]|uniref:tetratricopeptide repeat protein n=1 Tax=Candidatus Cardinium hertigii TaxID=247481 RepID=UPI003D7E41AB
MKIIDINSIPKNPSENDKAKAKLVSLKHNKRKWYVVGFYMTFLSIAAFLGFFYLTKTKNLKVEDDIFQAIYHFEASDFDKALKGEGSHKGFLEVIAQYPYTTTANIDCFYAGIAYMHQKEYEKARSFLSRFKLEDYILQARSWSVIGDTYSEQKNYKQAAAYYIKAARYRPNSVYTPVYLVKAASAFEADGQYKNSYRCYQEIVEKYPNSSYGSGLAIKEVSRLSAFLSMD